MKNTLSKMCLIIVMCIQQLTFNGQSVLNKFEIIGKQKQIDIPFQYTNHFILLKLLFQKSFPLSFIFDTGAEHTLLLKKEYADILSMNYDRRIKLIGADQSEEMYALIARGVGFGMSPTISYKQDILVLEQDFFQLDELTGLYIDGIASGNFFKTYITHINFKSNVLSFIQPNNFRISKKYTKIPIEITNGKIFVNAFVTVNNHKIPVKLLIDTGAGLPLLLYEDSNPDFAPPLKSIPGKLGKGLGGFLEGHIGKIAELQMETFKFPNIVTSFQKLDSAATIIAQEQQAQSTGRQGLIGNQLLDRFDIYIDYQKNYMYLSPIKDLTKEFQVDKSGLEILATGHDLKQYIVSSVIPHSPAEEAGMQKGDILRKVVGLSTNVLSLDQIVTALSRKVGRKINIQYLRDGKTYKTTIILRSLI